MVGPRQAAASAGDSPGVYRACRDHVPDHPRSRQRACPVSLASGIGGDTASSARRMRRVPRWPSGPVVTRGRDSTC